MILNVFMFIILIGVENKMFKIDKEKCIGCGACVGTCPDVYEFGDDGLAFVKVEKVKDDERDCAMEALENCPTGAITKEEKEEK